MCLYIVFSLELRSVKLVVFFGVKQCHTALSHTLAVRGLTTPRLAYCKIAGRTRHATSGGKADAGSRSCGTGDSGGSGVEQAAGSCGGQAVPRGTPAGLLVNQRFFFLDACVRLVEGCYRCVS